MNRSKVTIGKKLSMIQQILDKSNQEMAQIFGVVPGTYINYTQDKTNLSVEQLETLCRKQNISIEYFMSLGE